LSRKVLVEKKNDENTLTLRNIIYKFCKLHHYKVKMTYEEQTRLVKFKIEDE